MVTRLTDLAPEPLEARPIGRARPVAGAPALRPSGIGSGTMSGTPGGAPAPAPVTVAEPLLTQAEAQALVAERVAQARKQAAEAAAEKAYQEGFADGAKSVQSAQEQWLEKLQTGIAQSLEQLEHTLAQAEHLAVELARVTLERVLGCDEARVALLRDIVGQQMSQLSDASVLRVRLSERDLREHADLVPTLQARHGDCVQFVPDAQLAAGACVFELKLGRVDAGIDTHLELIRAHFSKITDQDAIA